MNTLPSIEQVILPELHIEVVAHYQRLAMKTAKIFPTLQENLNHVGLGITSDAGEAADAIKKHTIYGKELDTKNLMEELGDVLWFVTLGAHAMGWTLNQVMEENIKKLAKRYPEGYSDEAAIARADKSVENTYDISGNLEAHRRKHAEDIERALNITYCTPDESAQKYLGLANNPDTIPQQAAKQFNSLHPTLEDKRKELNLPDKLVLSDRSHTHWVSDKHKVYNTEELKALGVEITYKQD